MQGWINSSQMAKEKWNMTHIHISEAIANMQKFFRHPLEHLLWTGYTLCEVEVTPVYRV